MRLLVEQFHQRQTAQRVLQLRMCLPKNTENQGSSFGKHAVCPSNSILLLTDATKHCGR